MSKSLQSETPSRRRTPIRILVSAGAVATLAGLAYAATTLHAAAAQVTTAIDTEVVVLFVPLCALMFALMLEVGRTAIRGPVPARHARVQRARSLRHWPKTAGDGA